MIRYTEDGEAPYYSAVIGEWQVLLLHFPAMLILAMLGAVLGPTQTYVALPESAKVVCGLLYGLGVLGFVFQGYFNMLSISRTGIEFWPANPFTWAVMGGMIAIVLSLVINAYGVARFRS